MGQGLLWGRVQLVRLQQESGGWLWDALVVGGWAGVGEVGIWGDGSYQGDSFGRGGEDVSLQFSNRNVELKVSVG